MFFFPRINSVEVSETGPWLRPGRGGPHGEKVHLKPEQLQFSNQAQSGTGFLLLVSLPLFPAGIRGFPHRLNSTEGLFVTQNALLLLLLEAWLEGSAFLVFSTSSPCFLLSFPPSSPVQKSFLSFSLLSLIHSADCHLFHPKNIKNSTQGKFICYFFGLIQGVVSPKAAAFLIFPHLSFHYVLILIPFSNISQIQNTQERLRNHPGQFPNHQSVRRIK